MAVTIDVVYQGDLRCEAVHGPSKTRLHTDAPVDNQGKGESFSPTDLVATAIGTCMLTLMGMAAARRGIVMTGATAHVEKHMVADPLRRIDRLPVVLTLPSLLDPEARQLLERAALTCPVFNSLDPRIDKTVTFRYLQ